MWCSIPNWFIHTKWAKKAGIDDLISNYVNRTIDYGLNWALLSDQEESSYNEEDNNFARQLKYFHLKDLEKKYSNEQLYVKAFYLHHLLDYFRETRYDVNNLELVLKKFLENEIIFEFLDKNGNTINYQLVIKQIFQLLRENQRELYEDLKSVHNLSLEKNREQKKRKI